MQLFQRNKKVHHIDTVAQEVFDVSGAGDTVIAAFTLALASGADFLTASQESFQNTAVLIVKSMGLTVQDVFLMTQDAVEIYALETQSRWRNAKKATIIVRLYRTAEPIGYDDIRGLYDQMRKVGAMRSICIVASQFSKSAVEFAQIRPIDLVDKEKFTKLLHSTKE